MIIDENDQMYPELVEPVVAKDYLCGDRPVFEVDVEGVEYGQCAKFSCYGSRKGETTYQRGSLSSESNPNAECRVGKLMEVGIAKVFHGLPVDFQYRVHGDREDFRLFGGRIKIDAKCSAYRTAANHRCNFLTAIYSSGNAKPVNMDIYIGGYLREDDLVAEKAKVVIAGFLLKEDVLALDVVPAPAKTAKWKNRELRFATMRPISSLRRLYMQSLSRAS